MKKYLLLILAVICSLSFVSCLSVSNFTKGDSYGALYDQAPVSILIMPPINESVEVEIKDSFYSTLAVPLADAGYYVFPSFLSMELLQRESAYDAELFYDKSADVFNDYFGADMVLFTRILDCEKSALFANVKVSVEYVVKSAKTDDVLFHKTVSVTMDTSSGVKTQSLLGALAKMVVEVVNTATVDYLSLARKANDTSFQYIPKGKYHPDYLLDKDSYPGPESISVSY